MTRGFKITSVALLLGAGAAGLVALHLDNRRLEHRLAQASPAQSKLETDNRTLREILQVAQAKSEAKPAVREQLEQARAELAALEARAAARYAEKQAAQARETAMLAANRDPRLGMTRPSHFQAVGQATPSNAFQTAIWAAMKNDEAALARVGFMLPATRAEAEALIAKLPAESRPAWTPEKLAALWFGGVVSDVTALQITGEQFEGPDAAVVTFRLLGEAKDEHVNVKLTRDGWRVVLPSNAMSKLTRQLNGTR